MDMGSNCECPRCCKTNACSAVATCLCTFVSLLRCAASASAAKTHLLGGLDASQHVVQSDCDKRALCHRNHKTLSVEVCTADLKPSQAKPSQARPYHAKSCQVMPCHIMPGQARPGQASRAMPPKARTCSTHVNRSVVASHITQGRVLHHKRRPDLLLPRWLLAGQVSTESHLDRSRGPWRTQRVGRRKAHDTQTVGVLQHHLIVSCVALDVTKVRRRFVVPLQSV
jgi:hypothetical protein